MRTHSIGFVPNLGGGAIDARAGVRGVRVATPRPVRELMLPTRRAGHLFPRSTLIRATFGLQNDIGLRSLLIMAHVREELDLKRRASGAMFRRPISWPPIGYVRRPSRMPRYIERTTSHRILARIGVTDCSETVFDSNRIQTELGDQ